MVAAGVALNDALDVAKHWAYGTPKSATHPGAYLPEPRTRQIVNEATDDIIDDLKKGVKVKPDATSAPRSQGAIRGARLKPAAPQIRQNGTILRAPLMGLPCVGCTEKQIERLSPKTSPEA